MRGENGHLSNTFWAGHRARHSRVPAACDVRGERRDLLPCGCSTAEHLVRHVPRSQVSSRHVPPTWGELRPWEPEWELEEHGNACTCQLLPCKPERMNPVDSQEDSGTLSLFPFHRREPRGEAALLKVTRRASSRATQAPAALAAELTALAGILRTRDSREHLFLEDP